jgi:dTDP-4-amino-4,6-dideoxygalactose transaminase
VTDHTLVRLGPEEEALVLEVLRSGQLAQGPKVAELERRFAAEVSDTRHAVAVSSGTAALVLALATLDLAPGDEVVTSPFTFAATVNAALQAGAVVRFCDIRADDFTLDPEHVATTVDDRTRAVVPVHLYGHAADMTPIGAAAARVGAVVIEDAAQAHLATYGGRRVGGLGAAGCFSFYATKNMTTGEGGMVTTDDDALADRVRLLRSQGMRRRYEFEEPGHNFRLTDLQAAVGIPQIARLPTLTERRRTNAARLHDGLAGVPGLVLPVTRPGRGHAWHQYTVRVTSEAAVDRDGLAAALGAAGIGSGIHYARPVSDHACYRDHPRVVVRDVPVAAAAAREVLSLPVHPWLSDADLDRIVTTVRDALEPVAPARRRVQSSST